VSAQTCPPSGFLLAGPPSGLCPWTTVTTLVPMSGNPNDCTPYPPSPPLYPTACCIQITFCYRCCSGLVQSFINEVDVWNSLCSGTPPADLIHFAANWANNYAISQGTSGTSCDVRSYPCGGPTEMDAQSYVPICWSQSAVTGEYVYLPCSCGGYCFRDCQVCWNGSAIVYSNCIPTNGSGTCPCTSDPGWPWLNGTCYSVTCAF
jgi:hypothetical protein